MRLLIVVIFGFYAQNLFASGCYRVYEPDEHSEANLFRFQVNVVSRSEKSTTFEVKAPSSIDGTAFKHLSLARSDEELGMYLFPIQMPFKNRDGQLTTGFEILNAMIGEGQLQFVYDNCDMVFTYPLEKWVQP